MNKLKIGDLVYAMVHYPELIGKKLIVRRVSEEGAFGCSEGTFVQFDHNNVWYAYDSFVLEKTVRKPSRNLPFWF